MTFTFGYLILNYSTLRMIAESVRLKVPLKNSLAPSKKNVKQPLTGLYQTKYKFQAIVVKRNNKNKRFLFSKYKPGNN